MEKPKRSLADLKITALDGGSSNVTQPPTHLNADYHAFWRRLRRQVEISHSGITPAAESLIDAAARRTKRKTKQEFLLPKLPPKKTRNFI